MDEPEVEVGQQQGPSCLATVELACCDKVLQVAMVGEDVEAVRRALQEMPPLVKPTDDGEQLLVMDLVVALSWREALGEVRDWVPTLVSLQLRKHCPSGKLRAVGLDTEGTVISCHSQDRCGRHRALQMLEGLLLVVAP